MARNFQFDPSKLKAVILYVCGKFAPAHLGAVKMHKILYFSDMIHYVNFGRPLTGATFRKRQLGPTCDQLLSSLSELEKDGQLKIEEVNYFGFLKTQFIPLIPPDTSAFNESELLLLNEVVDFVCLNNTAKSISEFSHNMAWEIANFGEVLEYKSAYRLYPTQVSPEAMEWAGVEGRDLVDPTKTEQMVYTDFETFRNRVP